MRARTFDEVEFQAVAWLANKHLNPRGFHFSVLASDPPTWFIQGDGSEVAVSEDNEDLNFRLLEELLEECSAFYERVNDAGE